MSEQLQVLVTRESDPSTTVLVSCERTKMIPSGSKLLEAVIKAVTKWVQTKDGEDTFNYAGEDLNIGDIASHGVSGPLYRLLLDEGVKDFQIL
jgi:hypothetical protein